LFHANVASKCRVELVGINVGHSSEDRFGHAIDWQDLVGKFLGNGSSRHSEDDAGFFVLRENRAPRFAYRTESLDAVASHTGEDQGQGTVAAGFGNGAKQIRRRRAEAFDRCGF